MRRWIVAAGLVLAGCGSTPVADGPTPQAAGAVPPLQAANGPLQARRTPLSVDLAPSRDPLRLRFGRPPKAGLLFDLDTGEVLWRRDALAVRPIASLTKMMTALEAVDALGLRRRVRITKAAQTVPGSRVGMFRTGRTASSNVLLHGAMLTSGNDAATALAQGAHGSTAAFVAAMNDRARRMGLVCTSFRTPHGLSSGDRSCAADLATVARAVLDDPRLARIVRRRQVALPSAVRGGTLHLTNTNPLLQGRLRGTLGLKTGTTDKAGHCLVAAVRRGDRRLGIVLLGSDNPGQQARTLVNRYERLVRTES